MISQIIRKQGKIFIIDDEMANVRFLEILLQQSGYRNVHSTTDSRQAQSLLAHIQPDLLLLDLAMPHLDGFAVMRQVQEDTIINPVPILVMTADATPQAKHKALQSGAHDFLTKPLDETEVLLRISNLLETHFYSVLLEQKVRERTQEL